MVKGIVVGCDWNQEWILPWWWKHYSAHNSYPVLFVDFGLSNQAAAWCRKRGEYSPLSTTVSHLKKHVSTPLRKAWEKRFEKDFWIFRKSWLKKPYAFLQSPFPCSLWIDLDCQIKGSLEPIFHCLNFGIEMALAKDMRQDHDSSLPGEIHYNSGVVAFKQNGEVLHRWIEAQSDFKNQLPGDQDYLSRAIFIHQIPIFELPAIYNWPIRFWGAHEGTLIDHFCGSYGKLEILKQLDLYTSS